MTMTTLWATAALDAPSDTLTGRPGLVSALYTGSRDYAVAIFEVVVETASQALDVVLDQLGDGFTWAELVAHDTLEEAEQWSLKLLRRRRAQQTTATPEPTELEEILIAKDAYLDNLSDQQKWGELTHKERVQHGNPPPTAWVPIVKALRAARGL